MSTRSPREGQRGQDRVDRERALQRALARLENPSNNLSIHRVAQEEKVPVSTLARRFRGVQQNRHDAHRAQQRLTEGQEAGLASYLEEYGWQSPTVSLSELTDLANVILKADQKDAKPVSPKWAQAFLKRHPHPYRSMESPISSQRSQQRHSDSASIEQRGTRTPSPPLQQTSLPTTPRSQKEGADMLRKILSSKHTEAEGLRIQNLRIEKLTKSHGMLCARSSLLKRDHALGARRAAEPEQRETWD